MNLIAWGPGAWAPEAWARYAWEDDGDVPPVEEVSTGAGSGGKAKRKKRYPEIGQVTRQPRDALIEIMAQRRAEQVLRETVAQESLSPTLPRPVREIVETAIAKPWPALTEQAVLARPGGAEKWSQRQRLELRAVRVKFQDRIKARIDLARYEAQLQDELAAAAQRELDIVFVAAVMALNDEE